MLFMLNFDMIITLLLLLHLVYLVKGNDVSFFRNFIFLKTLQTLEALLDMFNKDNRDGSTYDVFMVMQAMR